MTMSSESAKEVLLKDNEEFKRLARKHRELDERITVLSERFILSAAEKVEEATLKKKKLALKDRMADFIRRVQVESSTKNGGARTAPA